ncbi:MAG TPA: PRC-barrel domain-containing protein [Thermomicrobiaceae bacterium]|nr:PRC-barrel domain-containing protein [Thermomicrobiaceae bacterium]
MSWQPQPKYDYAQLQSIDVYDASGNKIGPVDQVLTERPSGKHYLLVKGGPLGIGSDDYYIPETAIDMVGRDRVVVDIGKDELKRKGWTKPPTGDWMS